MALPPRYIQPKVHKAKNERYWRRTEDVVTEAPIGWRRRYQEHEADFGNPLTPGVNTVWRSKYLRRARTFNRKQEHVKTKQKRARRAYKAQRRGIRMRYGRLAWRTVFDFDRTAARRSELDALEKLSNDPKSPFYKAGVGERIRTSANVRVGHVRLWATFQLAEAGNWAPRTAARVGGLPFDMRPGRANHDWWSRTARARQDVEDIKENFEINRQARDGVKARLGGKISLRESWRARRAGEILPIRQWWRLRLVQARVLARKGLWITAESGVRGVINTGKTVAAAGVMGIIKSPAAMRRCLQVYNWAAATSDTWLKAKRQVVYTAIAARYKGYVAVLGPKAISIRDAASKKIEAKAQQYKDAWEQSAADRQARQQAKTAEREQRKQDRAAEKAQRLDPHALPDAVQQDHVGEVFNNQTPGSTADAAIQAAYARGTAALADAVKNGRFSGPEQVAAVVRAQHAARVKPGTGIENAYKGLSRAERASARSFETGPTPRPRPTPARTI